MSQSLVNNLVHLIYSTKDRKPWIPTEHRSDLFAYQAGIFKKWESPALLIGGAENHVHALFSLSKNHALKKIVEEVKKGSSQWMKSDGPRNAEFCWQAGYGAFSVSHSNVDGVKCYIANQEEHHRKMTFQDELRALLRRHEIEFDGAIFGIEVVSPFQGSVIGVICPQGVALGTLLFQPFRLLCVHKK